MTANELNLIIEAHIYNQKDDYKRQISASFYSAYFQLKGQKGLKGSDLKEVLDKIDGDDAEMSAEEILEACKKLL